MPVPPPAAEAVPSCTVTTKDHQGVLAFGDSITNGGGELQWGVALQSWVQWLARSLGMPFTNYAVDGARAADVISLQIPAHARLNAVAEPRYQLGCLYIGVNDVRSDDWDAAAYERDLGAALEYVEGVCDRVLVVTIPLDLGRPRVGPRVLQANEAIERQASQTGALVLDLRELRGREVMMFDHVHPTAMGQIAIAEMALDVLIANGFEARARPREFANPNRPLRHRIRGVFAYAYRSAKRSLGISLSSRLRRRR